MTLTFTVDGEDREFAPEAVVIAGFTGRDTASVRAHLEELAELGVPIPASTPSHYVAPPTAAVQVESLVTVGAETSGEAECVLLVEGDRVLLTLGSDHTDRQAESIDISLSKLVCPKPLASTAWPIEEVADHLDALELRSWATIDGRRELYQQGTLAEILPLLELLRGVPFANRPDRFVMFTGTVPAIGGIRPASRFSAELTDPIRARSIVLEYETNVLDVMTPRAAGAGSRGDSE